MNVGRTIVVDTLVSQTERIALVITHVLDASSFPSPFGMALLPFMEEGLSFPAPVREFSWDGLGDLFLPFPPLALDSGWVRVWHLRD